MTTVDIAGLRLARPGFRLGPLSMSVPDRGRAAVVGPSGAGKTTLLRCIAGLERPQAGTIRIGDATVHDAQRSVPPDRRGVGLVFQDGALWPHLTALQHLQFAAPRLPEAAGLALLDRAGLLHVARRKPGTLSGGEAQRLGLVRALAAGPSVLLLDEPLRSVDVHLRDELVLLVSTIAAERALTTILVTHDRDEALALATELFVLHDGRIVEHGNAAALLQQPATAFTAAFLGGAACLPTTRAGAATLATPFGDLPCAPDSTKERLLVLMPGDVGASPASHRNGLPRGQVLTSLPGPQGALLRVALGQHIVPALAETPLPVGSTVELSLRRPPRLLPWDDGGPA